MWRLNLALVLGVVFFAVGVFAWAELALRTQDLIAQRGLGGTIAATSVWAITMVLCRGAYRAGFKKARKS